MREYIESKLKDARMAYESLMQTRRVLEDQLRQTEQSIQQVIGSIMAFQDLLKMLEQSNQASFDTPVQPPPESPQTNELRVDS